MASEAVPAGTVGAVTEMAVAIDLMRGGWAVFRALSPSCHCDLIASKRGELVKVEVRTGYCSVSGNLTYPFSSKKDVKDRYDVMAVRVWAQNKTYFLDNEKRPIDIEKAVAVMKVCKKCGEIAGKVFTEPHYVNHIHGKHTEAAKKKHEECKE